MMLKSEITVMTGFAAVFSLLFSMIGVGCDQPIEGFAASTDGGTGGTVGGEGGTTPTGGMGGTGGTSSSSGPGGGSEVPEALPFAVDDYFAPSGFMGDGATAGNLEETDGCPMRAGEQAGRCHRVAYTTSSQGWAGIYWQYPDGNWGTSAGLPVPGAPARVTFWAWTDSGGETVGFFAGGIGDENTAFQDTFNVSQDIMLTSTPTEYTLDITGTPPTEVIGGFGWSAAGPPSGTLVFYVDDIQYRAAP